MPAAVWFGDSWTVGTELEKSMDTISVGGAQDEFRARNRFSRLVSDSLGWKEINLAQEGISAEHLVLEVDRYLRSDPEPAGVLFVIWPSFQRYFWVDQQDREIDIRWHSAYHTWYREIDNLEYQMYVAQRSIWSLANLLLCAGRECYMVNTTYRIKGRRRFALPVENWMLPMSRNLGDILEVDLDRGFPGPERKHKFFWPGENHPNQQGHRHIADHIIAFMDQRKSHVSVKS